MSEAYTHNGELFGNNSCRDLHNTNPRPWLGFGLILVYLKSSEATIIVLEDVQFWISIGVLL